MSVFRVHLKPSIDGGVTYSEILDFCKKNEIIGVGWASVKGKTDDYYALKQECDILTGEDGVYKGDKGVFKSVNAIRQIQPGDFIWTRDGGKASTYYLCRASELRWTDRIVTDEHIRHDITNFVGCKWITVGSEDKVPGHVVNSFRPTLTAQHVYNVDKITSIIWNRYCDAKDRIEIEQECNDDFWNNLIGTEDLECLVLLYLQSKGYYVYSSTIKKDTKTYEAVLVSKDGSHRCYPQVKQNEELKPIEYIEGIDPKDCVVLFSSCEAYGESHPQVKCLKRKDLEEFIINNYALIPERIKAWIDYTNMKDSIK